MDIMETGAPEETLCLCELDRLKLKVAVMELTEAQRMGQIALLAYKAEIDRIYALHRMTIGSDEINVETGEIKRA